MRCFGAMVVGERLFVRPVRQERAEIEELQRRQDRRRRPEQQDVCDIGAPISSNATVDRRQDQELRPAEIAADEARVPGQQLADAR